jgi:methionyl aminopeptidase
MPVLTPGRVSPRLTVPAAIPRPEYVGRPGPERHRGSEVKDADTIARMRVACRLAAQALELVGRHVAPGVSTDELDLIGHDFLIDNGAYPSTLGYRGFPKSLCTSVNEVICHGIPDSTVLAEGDIVNVDITAFLGGVHGDTNATFLVGDVAPDVRLLVERTHAATMRGIKAVAPGRPINVVGRVIESYARRFGYGVVREFTGHGIGTSFHSGLIVPHYDDPRARTLIEPGMTFTVEPMITMGSASWRMWNDGWTVVTADGSWTAQFEHTVLVTDDGAEILTLP